MLSPLEALSIASAIIQIIDFGCKLVSQTQEIYHSANGATKDNVTSAEIVKDINALNKELKNKDRTFQRLSLDDIALGKLVDSCEHEAEALRHLLSELEVPPDAKKWESFRVAFRSARKKGMVKDIENRLLKLQKQIDSRLQSMMKCVSDPLVNPPDLVWLVINSLLFACV